MNLSYTQQKKLEKVQKLLEGGNVNIITQLLQLEDRLDNDIPQISELMSRLQGEKWDSYVVTDEDKAKVIEELKGLFDDNEIVTKVLSMITIPVDEIALKASKLITTPTPEKIDYIKIKKEILQDIVIPEGQNGKDADETIITEKVIGTLENKMAMFREAFRDGLESLQGDERLDKSAIRGLDEIINLAKEPKGISYTGLTGIKELIAGSGVTINNSNLQYPVISVAGGTGGGHIIEDEGTPLTQRSKLNFVGAGVTVTDNAGDDATVVTITGGGTGGAVDSVNGQTGVVLIGLQSVTDVGATTTNEISVPSIQFDITKTGVTTEGQMEWNEARKTLEIGLKGGYRMDIENTPRLVVNKTGSTLDKLKVCYINGNEGNRPTVALASNATEATSSKTFIVLDESIANNNSGYGLVNGMIYNVNTSTYTAGQTLYLGTSGNITNTKPVAPAHMVSVGKAINIHATEGSIEVNIQNGFELEELHDVLITSPATNDIIFRDSDNLWKNVSKTTFLSGVVPYSGATTDINTGIHGITTNDLNISAQTASRAAVFDASKNLISSTTTDTEIGYVSGVTSSIQTQLNAKGSGTVTSVSGTTDRITSTGGATPVIDISSTYAGQNTITTLGTVATGVWNASAIALNKITALTASKAIVSDVSGFLSSSATTNTEIGYVSGVTSAIQTQLNAKQGTLTLTTTGTSGASTLVGNTLNIPQYAGGSSISLSAIGSTPNANAATLTGSVLNLEPASASFGGIVTTGTQTFAGAKTFSSTIDASNISTAGTVTAGYGTNGFALASGWGNWKTVNAGGESGNIMTSPYSIYISPTGSVVFKPGNVEQMRITSTGSVGIGTTTPKSVTKLEVVTSATTGVLMGYGTAGVLIGYSGNTIQGRTGVDQGSNGNLFLNPYGGTVGIYESSPSASTKLAVLGGVAIGSDVSFSRAAAPTGGMVVQGNVGIGIATPTAVLHLKAGTATANTAPLKLTAGTNLTTPENGAFEFDGTNLYFTVGSTRKTVTLV